MTPSVSSHEIHDVGWRCRPGVDVVVVRGEFQTAVDGRLCSIDAPPRLQALLAGVVAKAASPRSAESLRAVFDAAPSQGREDVVVHAMESLLEREHADGGDRPAVLRHAAIARWYLARRTRKYRDYSTDAVYGEDAEDMQRLLETEHEPPAEPEPKGPAVLLPHPATAEPVGALAALGALLYWTMGRQRPALFLDLLHVHLKAVPSFGARHPFDAELSIPPNSPLGLPAGQYIYHPSSHTLRRGDGDATSADVRIRLRPDLNRVSWRYRYPMAYESTLLDLGHLCAAMRMRAATCGITLVGQRLPKRAEPCALTEEWQDFRLEFEDVEKGEGAC